MESEQRDKDKAPPRSSRRHAFLRRGKGSVGKPRNNAIEKEEGKGRRKSSLRGESQGVLGLPGQAKEKRYGPSPGEEKRLEETSSFERLESSFTKRGMPGAKGWGRARFPAYTQQCRRKKRTERRST